MGVNLKDIMGARQLSFDELSQKTLAVDALNMLYQFLASIRQPDGTPLTDKNGDVTSHLSGLMYRTTNLIRMGIKPVYVFDGDAPSLKRDTLRARKAAKKEAEKKWESAKSEGRMMDARKYAKRTSRLTPDMALEAKSLLSAMGVPWIQAPSEAEAQCALLVEKEDAWAVASMDYDSLLFGAKRLVRGLAMSDKVELTMIELEDALKKLGITRDELIDLAILVGTDFDPGVRGIGPKKALKAVKDSKVRDIDVDFDFDAVRDVFQNHPVEREYEINWSSVNEKDLVEVLVEKHQFSLERVKKAAKELEKAYGQASQQSLSKWF